MMSDVLTYESRDGGTLEPGEELLWEGGDGRRQQPAFRVTNRRAFYIRGKADSVKHRAVVRWPFRGAITVLLPRRRLATIQFESGLLGLLDSERVIWTGRPVMSIRITWPRIRAKLITLGMKRHPVPSPGTAGEG